MLLRKVKKKNVWLFYLVQEEYDVEDEGVAIKERASKPISDKVEVESRSESDK